MELVQLLSLLVPVTILNTKSQTEAANQLDVLLTMYRVRMNTLNYTAALQSYTKDSFFAPSTLWPSVAKARKLMCQAFHTSYFCRYTDRTEMERASFVFEMQLMLHPGLKSNLTENLHKMVRICNAGRRDSTHEQTERNVELVHKKVMKKLRAVMLSIRPTPETGATEATSSTEPTPAPVEDPNDLLPPMEEPTQGFSEDLVDMFMPDRPEQDATPSQPDLEEERVDEEIDRWMKAKVALATTPTGAKETVLQFWRHQAAAKTYV